MLALTRKTGYALTAMTHLAELPPGQVASARWIARVSGAPIALLMNVMKELAAAGYVESLRGARGGYRLARLPGQINLADVVTSIEGPLRLSECVIDKAGERECTLQDMARCPVADPVHRVQRKLRDFLRKVTLSDITGVSAGSGRQD
jgi:Rrf2 family protein